MYPNVDPERVTNIKAPLSGIKEQNLLLTIKTIVHLIFLLHHVLVLIFALLLFFKLRNHSADKVQELCTYAPAFATNWNIGIQDVFIILSIAYDVLRWSNRDKSNLGRKIKYYRDIIFCGLLTPMTFFVFMTFWIVYLIDRKLVFPIVFDDVVPWWFNHCLHTNIVFIFFIETLLEARRNPTNLKIERTCYICVGLGYALVYYSVYFFAHRWLYDVFGVMNWWQIVLFQLLIWTSLHVFYILQFPFNRIFHKEKTDDECSNEQGKAEDINQEERKLETVTNDSNGKVNGATNISFNLDDEKRPSAFVEISFDDKISTDSFEKTKM